MKMRQQGLLPQRNRSKGLLPQPNRRARQQGAAAGTEPGMSCETEMA